MTPLPRGTPVFSIIGCIHTSVRKRRKRRRKRMYFNFKAEASRSFCGLNVNYVNTWSQLVILFWRLLTLMLVEPYCRNWDTRTRPWSITTWFYFLSTLCFLTVNTAWQASILLCCLATMLADMFLKLWGQINFPCFFLSSVWSQGKRSLLDSRKVSSADFNLRPFSVVSFSHRKYTLGSVSPSSDCLALGDLVNPNKLWPSYMSFCYSMDHKCFPKA